MAPLKILGIIPARFNSTRLPGKPLYNFFDRPMIWWVYQETKKVAALDRVVVAGDDQRIMDACQALDMEYIKTSAENPTHLHRLQEVASRLEADYYVCVCGDEPLITAEAISHIIPAASSKEAQPYASLLTRAMDDRQDIESDSNIKVVTNIHSECMLFTRGITPYDFGKKTPVYRKIIGVECYNKSGLDFFVSSSPGFLEETEDIALLRFLEHGFKVRAVHVDTYQLSVDNQIDLVKVKKIMTEREGFAHG